MAITFVSEADMRSFAAIERFLGRDILKNPLPEGLGEGPEYKTNTPHKSSRGKGGRKRYGKSKGGKKNQKPNQKPEQKPNQKRKPKAKGPKVS